MVVINVLFVLFFFLFFICLWIMIWDSNRFVTKTYQFTTNKIEQSFRFVFLTDLHNKEYGNNNVRLVQAIEEADPTFILVGGDMINAKLHAKNVKPTVELLKNLSCKYPIYYAYGNHEHRAKNNIKKYHTLFQDYREQIKNSNIHFLDNESVFLEKYGIDITGISLEADYYKKFIPRILPPNYIEKKVGKRKENTYQILLAHNPEYFRDYANWDADLVLSGHIHGGVARIPYLGGVISPALHLFPHYDGGLYQEFGHKMILGRGLGMHTIPLRFLNPGELVIVDLRLAI